MNDKPANRAGIGMTSARTRERLIQRLRDQGIVNAQVLDQIRNVPRHLFVDEALATRAYEDTALPIGHGQTISQPFVVAKMSEALLEGGTPGKVLEIGRLRPPDAVLAPLGVSSTAVDHQRVADRRASLQGTAFATHLRPARFRAGPRTDRTTGS